LLKSQDLIVDVIDFIWEIVVLHGVPYRQATVVDKDARTFCADHEPWSDLVIVSVVVSHTGVRLLDEDTRTVGEGVAQLCQEGDEAAVARKVEENDLSS